MQKKCLISENEWFFDTKKILDSVKNYGSFFTVNEIEKKVDYYLNLLDKSRIKIFPIKN